MTGLVYATAPFPVMAALEAAIQAGAHTSTSKIWMAGSSLAMTNNVKATQAEFA